MSLLEVNKITPQSGTTLTLGDSGDTINFGSGVLPNFENLTVTGDLTVDTNSLYVDSANNRVGIGTASPTYSLQVDHQGSENVTIVAKGLAPGFGLYDTTASAYNWALYNSDGNFVYYNTLNTNGFNSLSEKMRITSGGNVGIGTSTINDRFVVQSSSANEGISIRGGGFDALKIGMVDPGVTSNDGVIGMTINNNLRFITNNTERMRITSSGNVGIGKIPDASYGSYDALEIGNAGFLTSIGSGNENIFIGSNAYLNGSGSWTYMTTNEATYYRQGDGIHSWNYAPSGTADTAITFSEAMRIDSSGTLLIGRTDTTATNTGLELEGTGTIVSRRNGNVCMFLDRKTSDGTILEFRKDNSTVGSIGSSGGVTGSYIGDTTVALTFYNGANLILPSGGSSLNKNGVISLGNATNRFNNLYLAGSVYLGGTGSANALSDYEEGTWNPVLGGSTSESGQSYSRQSGHYVKVGKMVFCTFNVILVTEGTISGNAVLKGLPFTVSSLEISGDGGRGNRTALNVGYWDDFGTSVNFFGGFSEYATTRVNLYITTGNATNTSAPSGADLFANGTEIIGAITYNTDS